MFLTISSIKIFKWRTHRKSGPTPALSTAREVHSSDEKEEETEDVGGEDDDEDERDGQKEEDRIDDGEGEEAETTNQKAMGEMDMMGATRMRRKEGAKTKRKTSLRTKRKRDGTTTIARKSEVQEE